MVKTLVNAFPTNLKGVASLCVHNNYYVQLFDAE